MSEIFICFHWALPTKAKGCSMRIQALGRRPKVPEIDRFWREFDYFLACDKNIVICVEIDTGSSKLSPRLFYYLVTGGLRTNPRVQKNNRFVRIFNIFLDIWIFAAPRCWSKAFKMPKNSNVLFSLGFRMFKNTNLFIICKGSGGGVLAAWISQRALPLEASLVHQKTLKQLGF